MLPDMSDVLTEWEQSITIKTQSTITVDFEPIVTVVADEIRAVVQPADKTKLNLDSIDWSKEYVLVHKKGAGIRIGQIIEWDGRDFKIIGPNGNYKNYGFNEFVAEETKKILVVE